MRKIAVIAAVFALTAAIAGGLRQFRKGKLKEGKV